MINKINIIRHGPKNNKTTHKTGIEALLLPEKIHEVLSFATDTLRDIPSDAVVEVSTTPIDRAKVTAQLIYQVFSMDPRIKNRVYGPIIDPLVGSAYSGDFNAENLSSPKMSEIWGKAKKDSSYDSECQKEHRSLYAWCKVGFDNTWGDTGISLREIACRLGSFVHQRLTRAETSDRPRYDLGVSHSGDIEPWMYLTLEMNQGGDGTQKETMVKWFNHTGGGLNPVSGVKISYDPKSDKVTFYHQTKDKQKVPLMVNREIFREQHKWLMNNSIALKILEKRK